MRRARCSGRRRSLRLSTALVALCLLQPAAVRAETPLPAQGPSPPGANDFNCRPPARHPYPIVLVHGTVLNMASWHEVAPALKRLGYCVFALDYGDSPVPGVNAVGDIPTSASQLATFVTRVLAATGARKVSIVGHSQGGMMPRYYIEFLGGAPKVDELVAFSPSNHGTTNPLASPLGLICPACAQQVAGSAFLTQLNSVDQTPGPVDYTVIQTNHDEVVTPYQSAFLTPEGGRVTNVLLQDRCPADNTEHVFIINDPVAIQWMLNAVGRPGPADANFRPGCGGAGLANFPDSNSARPPASRSRAHRSGARLAVAPVAASARPGGGILRIVIRATGQPVRAVRLVIRGRGGALVGRSRALRVVGRRIVTVRLRRTLRAGRYLASAVGRDGAGRPVRARRGFSVGPSRSRH